MFKFFLTKDFWYHVFCCFIIAVFVGTIIAHTSVGNALPAILGGFFAGFFCGLGKEYGDSRAEGNHWSNTDLVGDILGALIGCQIGWVALLI